MTELKEDERWTWPSHEDIILARLDNGTFSIREFYCVGDSLSSVGFLSNDSSPIWLLDDQVTHWVKLSDLNLEIKAE